MGSILLSHWPKRSHRSVPHPTPQKKNSQSIVQTVDYSLYSDGRILLLKTTYVVKHVNRGGAQLEASLLPTSLHGAGKYFALSPKRKIITFIKLQTLWPTAEAACKNYSCHSDHIVGVTKVFIPLVLFLFAFDSRPISCDQNPSMTLIKWPRNWD